MRKKRRELILFCSLLLASTPAYAENATEAVSISDTASDIGWTVDAIEEVQSVSESDTPETLASNEETSSPKIWQETYTYLADTQDSHAFPVFSLRPDIGRRLKTCRFDLAVKKKSREKLCPIRTHAAKKVIKEGVCNEYLHSWDQRKRYKVT